jgi:molecular chaperone DnaK
MNANKTTKMESSSDRKNTLDVLGKDVSTDQADDDDHHPTSDDPGGVWIGIDLGTSNSACAVWDSTRGSPKWMRLPQIASAQTNGKVGRIMPSVVRFEQPPSDPSKKCKSFVGAMALEQNDANSSLLQSVKRLLGKRYEDLDPQWLGTLDYDVIEEDSGSSSFQIKARTSSDVTVVMTPQEILAIELNALRTAAQTYLDRYRIKKNLQVPGCGSSHTPQNTAIRNVVVGVPAHFSKRHIQLIHDACRTAGFDGHVGTCLESTAAAMAYGLAMQETSQNAVMMVVDMGGGTTDITIATQQKVLVTLGDENLGGDDIDQVMMEYCASKVSMDGMRQEEMRQLEVQLKLLCRNAKEALCSEDDPSVSETVVFGRAKHRVVFTQEVFQDILGPWLDRAKGVVLRAKYDLQEKHQTSVDEVILVGGTTRIPAVRRVIQDVFPEIELSRSLNPMSSVAQGLAIQAAIASKQVPLHELKSALMLDVVPHAIGVQLPDHHFVEIIPRNTPLPAKGTATFTLADKYQAGVTVMAVEQVKDNVYEPMSKEDFSFLLRRLSPPEFEGISQRCIQVGMVVDRDGKFIVSIFDELDPEQVRKKERFERIKGNEEVVGELEYITDLILAESGVTSEQFFLTLTLIGVIVAYIAVRIAFSDPSESDGTILG